MKKAGSGIPKMTNKGIVNGSKAQNKGGTPMKAGTNQMVGKTATRITKVR